MGGSRLHGSLPFGSHVLTVQCSLSTTTNKKSVICKPPDNVLIHRIHFYISIHECNNVYSIHYFFNLKNFETFIYEHCIFIICSLNFSLISTPSQVRDHIYMYVCMHIYVCMYVYTCIAFSVVCMRMFLEMADWDWTILPPR